MPTIVTASSVGTPTLQADSISDQAGSGSPTFPNGLNISGQNRLADGTVSVPSIAFTNSTTTGLFRKAADSVGFSAAGVEIGSFSASGAWTFGPVAGVNDSHRFYNAGVNGGAILRLRNANNNGVSGRVARLQFEDYSGAIADAVMQFDVLNGTSALSQLQTFVITGQGLRLTGATSSSALGVEFVAGAGVSSDGRMTGSAIASATVAGAWTFGPAAGATALTHIIRSGTGNPTLRVEAQSGGSGSNDVSISLVQSTVDFTFQHKTSDGSFNLNRLGSTYLSCTNLGAWSLGDAARVSNNTVHSIFGSINIRTQSTNQNVIGHNVNRNGNSGIPDMRGSTAFGGVGIETALDTGSTFTRLRFISNTPGQSISLDGSIRGAMNAAGNWFFGTSGSGNVVSVNGVLAVRESANSGVGTAIFRNDSNGIAITTTADFDTGQNASCALVVVVNASNGQADLILKNGNSIVNISVGNIPSITYSIVNGAGSGSAIRITNNGVARAFRVSFLGSSSNDFGLTGIA